MGNKNRQKVIGILVASLAGIFLLSCGLIYQLIVQNCVLWTCAPSRTFTIYDLILPVDIYPPNSIVNPMLSVSETSAAEQGVLSIFWNENEQLYKSIFIIRRFGNEDKAIEYFTVVRTRRSRDSYHPHPDIIYRSQIANEFEIGCGVSHLGGEYECNVDARYEEFVVSLNASITGQMSEKDFEELVISLDKQFEAYLSE
jgi:hypothetical protein